jgi:hypothetical protein
MIVFDGYIGVKSTRLILRWTTGGPESHPFASVDDTKQARDQLEVYSGTKRDKAGIREETNWSR